MKLVTVKMPDIYVRGIEELVKAGVYSSRSEAIRVAVRDLLKKELWRTGIPVPGNIDEEAIPEPPVSVGEPAAITGIRGLQAHGVMLDVSD
ncbi:MAG: ribbon-helix-helix domain-containing protein [Desulfurococcales archaeon]|nr:ribbon-helix-helix domain-containing protein [Desulfurococcales archaeon]